MNFKSKDREKKLFIPTNFSIYNLEIVNTFLNGKETSSWTLDTSRNNKKTTRYFLKVDNNIGVAVLNCWQQNFRQE